jgi:hypothetical protein
MRKPAVLVVAAITAATLAVTASACSAGSSGGDGHHRSHHRAPHAPKGFFGVVTPRAVEAKDASLIRRTGIHTAHFGMLWPFIESTSPKTPTWKWVDNIVGPLAAKGVRTVPFVWGSPHWVAPAYSDSPLRTAAGKQAWSNFLKAAVRRYGPDGTYWTNAYRAKYPDAKPMPIQTWQIWNEPTLKKFFSQKGDAKAYGNLVRVAHQALTSEDEHAKVILAGMPGGTKPSPQQFLRQLYRIKGIKSAFSGVALHPYAKNTKILKREIKGMRRAMRSGHDAKTKLWLTEIGWGSGHPNRFGHNKGLKGQKRLLQKSFRLLLEHRRSWRIHGLYWFTWRDPPPDQKTDCSFCGSAGLLRYDFTPKPAWKAFRQFAKR